MGVGGHRALDLRQPLLSLVGRVDEIALAPRALRPDVGAGAGARRLAAEQRRLEIVQGAALLLGGEDLAEVVVDGPVVVDDQDPARDRLAHASVSLPLDVRAGGAPGPCGGPTTALIGSSRVKIEPAPGPSLAAVSEPPSELAASADACRPKP